MLINRFVCPAIALSITLGASAATNAVKNDADAMQLVTPFTIAESTQVPGRTLKAGNYAIRVVDHLSDRVILQIEDAKGASQTRFLGLESSALRTADRSTGPLSWANGSNKKNTLRGFAFPGGATVEFVYPKADAVLIAKVNAVKVPAIDPASEGRVSAKNLSKEDLQTVTLWTLLSTRVGPENASQPAIEAERYQAPQRESLRAANQQPVQPQGVARPPSSRQDRISPIQTARSTPLAQISSIRRTKLAALPHTASSQPTVALLGLIALMLSGVLRYMRLSTNEG